MKDLRKTVHSLASLISDLKQILVPLLVLLTGLGVDGFALGFGISKWMIQPLTKQTMPINPLFLLVLLILLVSSYLLLHKIKILSKKDEYEYCKLPTSNNYALKLKKPKTTNEASLYFCPICYNNNKTSLVQFVDEAVEDWYQCDNYSQCKFIIKTPKKLSNPML